MLLAAQAFGKPEIQLVGDQGRYWPWLNVPFALTAFTHGVLDADDYFGDLVYMSGAYMDETMFPHKNRPLFVEMAQAAMNPIQKAVFRQAGGKRTLANHWLSRFSTWLGAQ